MECRNPLAENTIDSHIFLCYIWHDDSHLDIGRILEVFMTKLKKAREYEALHRPQIKSQLPAFHLTGGVGWINDPNGFAPYQGEYHLFFQYNPYDTQWGPMHWGHAKTKDFIRWGLLPAALAPEEEYDKDGCFSGGALELPDGRHLLLYTGVSVRPEGEQQTQCIAIGDGCNYEKYPRNPVITAKDIPEGSSTRDFRDPKIWMEKGIYYAVAVNRGRDGSGDILLFESKDCFRWTRSSTLFSCGYRFGTMWECPDYFHLGGSDVLIHSAMEMRAKTMEFHNGNCVVYHIGHTDEEKHFHPEISRLVDYGIDFYAPQTLQAMDGRRIMIGWMQSWDGARQRIPGLDFMGQMTVPRELTIRDGHLLQSPVRELEAYRTNKIAYQNIVIQKESTLPGLSGKVLDMVLEIVPVQEGYGWFRLQVNKADGFHTDITIYPQKRAICLDRTYSGFPYDINHVREFPADFEGDGSIRLRLLLDCYSAELFVGDGTQAASMTLYSPGNADGISFEADAPVRLSVQKYTIDTSMTQDKLRGVAENGAI